MTLVLELVYCCGEFSRTSAAEIQAVATEVGRRSAFAFVGCWRTYAHQALPSVRVSQWECHNLDSHHHWCEFEVKPWVSSTERGGIGGVSGCIEWTVTLLRCLCYVSHMFSVAAHYVLCCSWGKPLPIGRPKA